MCASINHRRKKAEPSLLIPLKAYSKPRAVNCFVCDDS